MGIWFEKAIQRFLKVRMSWRVVLLLCQVLEGLVMSLE